MATPDYVTQQEKQFFKADGSGEVTLPANSFVRPIDLYYLPKHIKDELTWFNKETSLVCYCHVGMIIVNRTDIRKI